MFFVFGGILLIAGVWISTLTDRVPHYEIIYGYRVQTAWDTVHPYAIPAGLLVIFGLCIILVAVVNVVNIEKRARTEDVMHQIEEKTASRGTLSRYVEPPHPPIEEKALNFCPNCGASRPTPNPNFCPNCGLNFKETAGKEGVVPSFQTRPEKSPIQIEKVKLARTDGHAFFVLEIRNRSNKTATKVEVTPPFGSPAIIDLPDGVLKLDQTTKYTTTLVGDYYVGSTYVIIIKASYLDSTTSSVVVSVRCTW
jgi:hypothetical protein